MAAWLNVGAGVGIRCSRNLLLGFALVPSVVVWGTVEFGIRLWGVVTIGWALRGFLAARCTLLLGPPIG